MAPQPTPPPLRPRAIPNVARQATSTAFSTVATDLTVSAVTINGADTTLPLDDGSSAGNGAVETGTPTFAGVGGTLTVDSIDNISTTTTATSTPTSTSGASSSSTKSIPTGVIVAVFVVIAVLCLLFIVIFWWRKRRSRKRAEIDRERRMQARERNKSFVGGPEGDKEGHWEEFKTGSTHTLHVPGTLPSPSSTVANMTAYTSPETRLLNKAASAANPAPPRRFSVKSTFTGKVNPSNNFADESVEDGGYYYDDGKSTRSRAFPPMSPTSGYTTFRNIAPPPKMEVPSLTPGDDGNFLTFRSGEAAELQLQHNSSQYSFPPQPQQTPTPVRAPTTKSSRSGNRSEASHGHGHGQSQHGHIVTITDTDAKKMPRRKSTAKESSAGGHSMIALTNLIAALDTPSEPARTSYISERSLLTPADEDPHVVPSPSDEGHLSNPFSSPTAPRY